MHTPSTKRKHVLICTIVRDVVKNLDTWASQLDALARFISEDYDVSFSIFENDSVDGSNEWLESNVCISDRVKLTTTKLGTLKYGSIWSYDRLRNLAAARQACLDQVGDLSKFDKIAYIEPDVTYDPKWCAELILARHPMAAGLGEPDIYSGWSLRSLDNPKESSFLYDTCATRQLDEDNCWHFAGESVWRESSLVQTDLGGHNNNCLHRVWSTFNCFCVYNAQPFKDGLKWSYVNRRLNNGQSRVDNAGWLEADTVAICEDFRTLGCNRVYLNTNCLIRHV